MGGSPLLCHASTPMFAPGAEPSSPSLHQTLLSPPLQPQTIVGWMHSSHFQVGTCEDYRHDARSPRPEEPFSGKPETHRPVSLDNYSDDEHRSGAWDQQRTVARGSFPSHFLTFRAGATVLHRRFLDPFAIGCVILSVASRWHKPHTQKAWRADLCSHQPGPA